MMLLYSKIAEAWHWTVQDIDETDLEDFFDLIIVTAKTVPDGEAEKDQFIDFMAF